MVALEQSPFRIEIPNFKDSSFLSAIDKYITNLKRFNSIRGFLKNLFINFDEYIAMNQINSIEKIENILDTLDAVSEATNELLEDKHFKKWYMYPLYYTIDRVEDWNMALQGLLTSLEAQIAHKQLTSNDNQ